MPKILIADDSIAVRKVAERLLTEAGMTVSLAANGTEALAFLGRECPDVVVSDVIMPDKSGYEVCSFVRAQPNLAGIPVLLISGIVNDEVARQAETCHADGVLKKPFQGTSLKDRVHDLLVKRQTKVHSPAMNGAPPSGDRAVSRPPSTTSNDRPLSTSLPSGPPSATQDPVVSETAQVLPEPASSVQVEQLAGRVRELEAALANERDHVSRMTGQLQDAEPLLERTRELERLLSQERDEWRQREQALQTGFNQEREGWQQREQALQTGFNQEREGWQQREQTLQTDLEQERAKNRESSARIEQLSDSLAEEQRRAAEELAAKGTDVERLSSRIEEMESTLAAERRAMEAHSKQAAEAAQTAAARIGELEATLGAERDAAAQLVEQLTALEKLEGRVQDLETRLSAEHEKASKLERTISELEQEASRVKELEAALTRERERSAQFETALSSERQQAAILVQQVTEFEQAVSRARELDAVLAGERERSTQLAKRATEAEHLANQSNRRLEDMARKLAEIAGLASQLGNSQR
jgi:CheY-like chemotaxis protein